MKQHWSRREVLKQLAASSAAVFVPGKETLATTSSPVISRQIEIQIAPVSPHTFRLTVLPITNGQVSTIPFNGSLVQESWGIPVAKLRGEVHGQTIKVGSVEVRVSSNPLTATIVAKNGETIQQVTIDQETGIVSFLTGASPLLGLGEGGPQFDRRGSVDRMVSGQGGFQLETHGGRVPIPWLIGTSGWAMFIHQPFGQFDFRGTQSKFLPASPDSALPLDIFFVVTLDPAMVMAEYARLTGHAEMPPLWSLGYQQSHRTLTSREEILVEASTFREKKLPCDTLIYLGTGFCPSGWNTENGSFTWNDRVFPDPEETLKELHRKNFHVVLHAVILSDKLRGTVRDACEPSRSKDEQASCYWEAHRKDFAMGVDGSWPDEGDPMDIASRLVRNRMYWEGPQIDRSNERPYALHRNGYAGMQRYAAFLWSGDVYSTWETLKTHIPIAINTALTGIPYWGTDIGGFVPTKKFTAELYLRWFQFGAFCTLFRCHGRTWKLRLPWGWNTGDPGPVEIRNYGGAAIPDPSQLHNAQVEVICRGYLELRYRLLPYLYSAVRECTLTGMPIMRALWLHYPDDPKAVACGDQYLWGRDLLVAPVVEKGATARQVYLPRGAWYDFWTGERKEGGSEINRAVDLETMPLYVRAGSVLPLDPIKQYVSEKVTEPLRLSIFPGADSTFSYYEDDGSSFNYRKGEWMGIEMAWHDSRRKLTLRLSDGSRMLPPMRRDLEVSLEGNVQHVVFEGNPLTVSF